MACTRMACLGDSMVIENEFFAIFPLVARWEISGQTLRLLDEVGKLLATFQARPPDTTGAQPE